ncbi:ECF transporter S component [Neobacillus niacini]|uniref:ECF transporter S component n=1 Tax=Neobacillus niacini TaxID=86668 RepID=UPI0021CAF3F5|nr:ECF transporter S component [Neobacillus niacini]MCM3764315.1 ECF transporter S component [Neobacillus niacini]
MRFNHILTPAIFLLLAAGLLIISYWFEDSYLWLSFSLVFLTILFFLVRFEGRTIEPKELVLLAVLAAIAAVGRIPFASIPSVQPTTFVIMIAGLVFGAESGFVIGAVAALASNMIMGQGPWTPWQMVSWGLVGMTAGAMKNTPIMNTKLGRLGFGIVWGFLFGWIMNIWGFLGFVQSGGPIDLKAFLVYIGASTLFDTMHAVSNVVFLLLFGDIWIKILTRFKRKYGLLE